MDGPVVGVALDAGVGVALGSATVADLVLVAVLVAVEIAVLVVDGVSVDGAEVGGTAVAEAVSDGTAVGELGAELTVLVGVDVDPLPRAFFFVGVAVAWEVAASGAAVAVGGFATAVVGVLGCGFPRPFLGWPNVDTPESPTAADCIIGPFGSANTAPFAAVAEGMLVDTIETRLRRTNADETRRVRDGDGGDGRCNGPPTAPGSERVTGLQAGDRVRRRTMPSERYKKQ